MKKRAFIPVNQFSDSSDTGIVIDKLSFDDLPDLSEWNQPERHDRHSFFLLEKGNISMEIDFRRHHIKAPAIIYMHPDQVHRILKFKGVTVCSWAINNENLATSYRQLLTDITPAKPLYLKESAFTLLLDATSLCIRLSQEGNSQLHYPLMKDACNMLVALVISLYLQVSKSPYQPSRFEVINKSFNSLLDKDFATIKRPAEYARKLNISIPYLNECIKNVTGYSATHHIQQRVILEAKRLLYHSDSSVKEIAAALGYEDYSYFSRLFSKVTGMTPIAFRNKNRD